jgi:autotransporter-associated beta strand protein
MAGTARLTPNVDAAWDIRSLTFNVLAGTFTIESSLQNALTIGVGGLLNQSGLTQTIDAEIALSSDQTWTAEFGALQINGDVNGSGSVHGSGWDLTIAGSYDTIFNGRLVGLRTLTKTGGLALLLNGTSANTYTGTTYVNQGSLWLNKQVADGAIRGDLVIGDGVGSDRVTLLRDEQILNSPSRTVTVNNSGVFELNGFTETIDNLEVRGGRVDMTATGSILHLSNLTMEGGVIDNPAPPFVSPLYFSGPIVRSEAAVTTALIDAYMHINQAPNQTVTFDVADGAAEIDLDLTHLVSGAAVKVGAGTLRVRDDSHPFSYRIAEGTLVVGQPPAGAGLPNTTFEGGTLRVDASLNTITEIQIVGAATIDVPYDLGLGGEISGPGGLTKRGSGTLSYASINFPNTYAGATVVEEGTLVLTSQAGPNAAIVGNLVIGDGVGGPEADVVRLARSEQILSAPGKTVTVNSSGLFDLNTHSESVQDLIVRGGLIRGGGPGALLTFESLVMEAGSIATVNGSLIAHGDMTTLPAAESALISGKLNLNGQIRSIAVADGAASIDLDIPAAISSGGMIKTSPGTLRLSGDNTFAGGVTVSAGTLLIDGATGSATGTGPVTVLNATLAGAGTIAGSVDNYGLVSPGTSPGAFNVGGSYTQRTGGKLLVELASASSYDQLLVIGDVTLGGTLDVSLIGGYAPLVGHSYNILGWGGTRTGQFANVDLPTLGGPLVWDASQLYTTGVLSVALAGDYNGNGVVDTADYTVWRDSLGQMGTGLAADGDASGTIDAGDYNVWKLHFGAVSPGIGAGSGAGATGSASAVPEPNCLLLLLAGCILGAMPMRIWSHHE